MQEGLLERRLSSRGNFIQNTLIDPSDDFAPSSPGTPEGLVLVEDPELNRLIMDAAEQARLAGQGEPDRPPEGEGEGDQPPEGEGEGEQPPEGEG